MTRRAAAGAAASAPLLSLAGTPEQHLGGPVPCGFLHPGKGCTHHAVTFFPEAYARALPVYFPGGWRMAGGGVGCAVVVSWQEESRHNLQPPFPAPAERLAGLSAPPIWLRPRLQCTSSRPFWCTASGCCSPTRRQSSGGEPCCSPPPDAVACLVLCLAAACCICIASRPLHPSSALLEWYRFPPPCPSMPCPSVAFCCSKMALGVLRSSLFLSLYCTLAWRGACTGFNVAGRTSGAVIASSCWVAGMAVLVEKRSRRMELALYCLSRVSQTCPSGWCRCWCWCWCLHMQPHTLRRHQRGASWVGAFLPCLLPAGSRVVCADAGGVGLGAPQRRAPPPRCPHVLASMRRHPALLLRLAARRLARLLCRVAPLWGCHGHPTLLHLSPMPCLPSTVCRPRRAAAQRLPRPVPKRV